MSINYIYQNCIVFVASMPTNIIVLAHLTRYCSLHLYKPTVTTLPQTSSEHTILTPNLLWWLTDCSGPHRICPHCPSRNSPGPGNMQLSTSHSLDSTGACRLDLHLHPCLWVLENKFGRNRHPKSSAEVRITICLLFRRPWYVVKLGAIILRVGSLLK